MNQEAWLRTSAQGRSETPQGSRVQLGVAFNRASGQLLVPFQLKGDVVGNPRPIHASNGVGAGFGMWEMGFEVIGPPCANLRGGLALG